MMKTAFRLSCCSWGTSSGRRATTTGRSSTFWSAGRKTGLGCLTFLCRVFNKQH
jgi:hypothetical protein